MKKYTILLFTLLILPVMVFSQDKKDDVKVKKDVKIDKPERPAFESSRIIDNPTNVLYKKNTLEVQMSHRFGLINSGKNDLGGLWAPSNIRIGLSYSLTDRITVGYGTTKFDRLQDFNLKVGLLSQTRSNKIPVSIAYYGNYTIDARSRSNFNLTQNRYSFYNQIIIARRFSPNFSMQIAPSFSHYNVVPVTMKNNMLAVAIGGRYKISPQTSVLVDYSQPLTTYAAGTPEPGVSLGFEFNTSGHAFQVFLSNYNGILQQKNYMFNQNNFSKGNFLIGFNITRVYNF